MGREVLENLFASQGLSLAPDQVGDLFEEQVELYLDRFLAGVRPYEGAGDLVARLVDLGVRLALVTSSRRRVVRSGLPPDLARRFEVVITSDKVERYKPHPEPYLAALAELGLEPRACLAVENAPAGIDSARGAGLGVLGLTTTLEAGYLCRADRVFDRFDELTAYLEDLKKLTG